MLISILVGRVYLKNFYRRNNEEMKIMSNDNKELKNEGINKLTEEELEQVNGGAKEAFCKAKKAFTSVVVVGSQCN